MCNTVYLDMNTTASSTSQSSSSAATVGGAVGGVLAAILAVIVVAVIFAVVLKRKKNSVRIHQLDMLARYINMSIPWCSGRFMLRFILLLVQDRKIQKKETLQH